MKNNQFNSPIVLLDATIARTLDPESYPNPLPSAKEKIGVAPGDACKVGIRLKRSGLVEVMWVNVVAVIRLDDYSIWYGGFLHDDPYSPSLKKYLKEDDYIVFQRINIFELLKEAHELWEPEAKLVNR